MQTCVHKYVTICRTRRYKSSSCVFYDATVTSYNGSTYHSQSTGDGSTRRVVNLEIKIL